MNRNDATASLTDELLELPSKIADLQRNVVDMSQDLLSAEKSYSIVENEVRKDINEATDAAGKKLYSNSDARDAAFLSISANHVELNQKKDEVDRVKRQIQLVKIDIEQLSNRQRNLRSIAYLFAGSVEEA